MEKLDIKEILIYIITLISITSCFFSKNILISLYGYPNRYEGIFTILFYNFLYLNCFQLKEKINFNLIIKIIIITIYLNFIVSMLQLTGLYQKIFTLYKSNYVIGLTMNANFLGTLSSLIGMLTLGFYLKSNKNKLFYYLSFIISYITLLLANSTGPFISLIVTIIIYLIFLIIKKEINYKKLIIIFLSIVLLYPVSFINNDNINKEIKDNVNFIIDKDNSNLEKVNELGHGRIRIWKNVFKSIKKSPWIGYGPDNLALVYEKSIDDSALADKAHNIYLNIWVSSGIFALIAYLIFVFLNLKSIYKQNNNYSMIIAFCIILYSIQGIFNINVIEVTPYFYLLIALGNCEYNM